MKKKKSHYLVVDEKVEEKKLNCRWIIDFSHNFTCQIVKKGAKKKKKTLISFYVISKNKKFFFFHIFLSLIILITKHMIKDKEMENMFCSWKMLKKWEEK